MEKRCINPQRTFPRRTFPRRMLLLLAVASGIGMRPTVSTAQPQPAPTFLDQGWTVEDRRFFYATTQGSRLMRTNWFQALQRPNSQESFSQNLERFGYLPDPQSPLGMPVGFVTDGKGDKTGHGEYLGMTCAACHTGQVQYGNTLYQIDGAPTRGDLYGFVSELNASLQATAQPGARFNSFADKVLKGNTSPSKRAALLKSLKEFAARFQPYAERSLPPHNPWGPARADAFGMIFNRVAGYDLPEVNNYEFAAAPVSYPFLWGIPYHDKVQWNGSAPNTNVIFRLARNVGEVLGVFADVKLHKKKKGVLLYYPSSANRSNLLQLEHKLQYLRAPEWPSAVLGTPDPAKVAQGEQLYMKYCASCHKPFNPDKPEPVTVFMDPLTHVRTDPLMVMAPLTRMADTNQLAGTPLLMYLGEPLQPRDLVIKIVENATVGVILDPDIKAFAKLTNEELGNITLQERVMLRTALQILMKDKSKWTAEEQQLIKGLKQKAAEFGQKSAQAGRIKQGQAEAVVPAYKARPMDGVWATAPYLHNGSVVSLWELMLPQEQRRQKFYVGSPKFDPVNVGLDTTVTTGFLFDTALPGNSNQGHSGPDYGTDLPDDQKRAIVEYMKTYMKPR